MEQYHRRSRDGCVTCRSARIKCDELRPSCRKCQARNVPCEGYAKTLKWVLQPQPDICNASVESPQGLAIASSSSQNTITLLCASGTRRTSACRSRSIRALTRNPSRQLFSSDRELALFQHWWRVMPEISFPNPRRHCRLLEEHRAMVLDYGRILLPMVVTCAAGHLASTCGSATETEVLSLKQIAVQNMINALGLGTGSGPRQLQNHRQRHGTTQASTSSLDELSALISASLQLVGIEILQGSDMNILTPLLKGAIFLVEKLFAASSTSEEAHVLRYGTVIQMETKLLAYHDLMTCVPYPRKPLLHSRYWLKEVDQLSGPSEPPEPDMIMGFATDIMILTGECATIVAKLFHGMLATELFRLHRVSLLDKLEEAVKALPAPAQIPEDLPDKKASNNSNSARRQPNIHNPSIFAARSHARASQIFLLRAVDLPGCSHLAEQVVMNLEAAVQSVPVDSPSVTIMLWPLWVLGCEADDSDQGLARRNLVRKLLKRMHAKEGFTNIRRCLDTLETQMWVATAPTPFYPTPSPHRARSSSQPDALGTFSWVQACFHHHIRPVLA